VGWRLDRVFAPAAGRVGDLLSQALGIGEVVAAEHRLILDHTERVYEARYIPLEAPRRRDRRLFVVVRDITERKQAEAARQALIEVSRELAGTLDLAQATERVVATVVRLFRVRQSVFCRLDPGSGDLACAATAGEIEAVRTLINGPLRYDPYPYLAEGMEVEIVRGPLMGVRGRLLQKDRKARVVIGVTLIRQGASVELEAADVAPVSRA